LATSVPEFETVALTLGSLLAGFVNAIAGGGGLVTLPVLLGVFPQAEPAVLFGTNKASMICGTASAAIVSPESLAKPPAPPVRRDSMEGVPTAARDRGVMLSTAIARCRPILYARRQRYSGAGRSLPRVEQRRGMGYRQRLRMLITGRKVG
jgi:hypothetical protein